MRSVVIVVLTHYCVALPPSSPIITPNVTGGFAIPARFKPLPATVNKKVPPPSGVILGLSVPLPMATLEMNCPPTLRKEPAGMVAEKVPT